MQARAEQRYTVQEFLAWTEANPDAKCELIDGRIAPKQPPHPSGMAPELARHGLTKSNATLSLGLAIRDAGLPCWLYVDALGVEAAGDLFIPDILIQCGHPVDADARIADAPSIIVEIISPSTRHIDLTRKLTAYFRLPTLAHYLLVDPLERTVGHHHRDADGAITAVPRTEADALVLDPPGLRVDVAQLLP